MSSNIKYVGNSTSSSSINPISSKVFPTSKFRSFDNVIGLVRSDTSEKIIVTCSPDNYSFEGGLAHIYGYWKGCYGWDELAPEPASIDGGSIDKTEIFNRLKIRGVHVTYADSRPVGQQHFLTIRFEGAGIPQKYLPDVEVDGVGVFQTRYATYSDSFNNKKVTLIWPITESEYTYLTSLSKFSIKFNPPSFTLSKKPLVLVSPERFLGAYYKGFCVYPETNVDVNTRYKIGAIINSPDNIPSIGILGTFNSSPLGNSSDEFRFLVDSGSYNNSDIGAITVEGFGTFATKSGVLIYPPDGVRTYWKWAISTFANIASNTGLDFPDDFAYFSVDTTPFTSNNSITVAENTESSIFDRKGYSESMSGHHPAMGNLSNKTGLFPGRTIKSVVLIKNKNNNTSEIHLCISGNTTSLNLFNFLEFDGFNRYYFSDTSTVNYYSNVNITKYRWHIRDELYTSFPSSGSMQIHIDI